MPKKIDIIIKEDFHFLNNAFSKTSSRLQQDRIKTLLYVASKKYHYQSDIARKLGRLLELLSLGVTMVREPLCW